MKKLLLITGVLLLNLTITVFGAGNDIVASTSPFKVQINENSCIDNKTYPSLFYNNVVYIPMTYDVGESVGRNIEWVDGYEQDVLLLTEKESENIIEKNTIIENEIKPQTVSAEIADCTVAVCVGENWI